MCKFPEFFPPNILEYFEKNGITCVDRNGIYRLLKNGILNREAFYGTYQEKIYVLKDKNYQSKNANSFSTSCSINLEWIKNFLQITLREKPQAVIAIGKINANYGPSSNPSNNGHIHWWLYQDAEPEKSFSIFSNS